MPDIREKTREERTKARIATLGIIVKIQAERYRQMEAEGYTPERDDAYLNSELAYAAASYAMPAIGREHRLTDGRTLLQLLWPWDWNFWKPYSRERNLIRAAALIVAELERLERRKAQDNSSERDA